jgi:hypothetical protein
LTGFDSKKEGAKAQGVADPAPELPDGLFSYQKSKFGYIYEGLGMENNGIFYDHFVYITAIWYILWQFAIVCSHLENFPILVCLDQEKSGNTALRPSKKIS